MRLGQLISLTALLAWLAPGVAGAEFKNLNFEQASIPPTPPGEFGPLFADPTLAFPGWTMGLGGSLSRHLLFRQDLVARA